MDNETLKRKAQPKTQELIGAIGDLAALTVELLDESKAQTKMLDRLCTLKEEFQSEWFKVSAKKFRLSIIAAFLTCALLCLDVLKLNESSLIVAGVLDILNVLRGVL